MAKIVEMPLDSKSGEVVYIEVSDDDARGNWLSPVNNPAKPNVSTSALSFEQSLEKVRPALDAIVSNLKTYGVKEINVEFGLKLGGGVGFLFAKTESEMTFKVSMKVAANVQGPPNQ